MKIEAKHIQGILDRANIVITVVKCGSEVLTGADTSGFPLFIANALNKDQEIATDIAALKMREKIAHNSYLVAKEVLFEEYNAIADDVDQEIAKRAAKCKHNIRLETKSDTFTECGGVRLEDAMVLTCGICGAILDKEMFGG